MSLKARLIYGWSLATTAQTPVGSGRSRLACLCIALCFALGACQRNFMRPILKDADSPSLELLPRTLRNVGDRYVIPVADSSAPYYVLKSGPNAREMKRVLCTALDHGVAVVAAPDPRDPQRLRAVRLAVSVDRLEPLPCPDEPRFTREFWISQRPAETEKKEAVRWIIRQPGCRVYHVSFTHSAAFYLLHEEHPDVDGILKRAWTSIDLDRPVRWAAYESSLSFIATIEF
jgi:hypothetical protein